MENLSLLIYKGYMNFKIIIFSICLISFSCGGNKPETDIDHSVQYVLNKYENGNIHRLGMMVDSIQQGVRVVFFPDGKIHYFEFYLNGEGIGPVVGFYKNGRLRSYYFVNNEGKQHGEFKSFFDNGQISSEFFSINGSIHGLLKRYDRDGNIKAIWEYNMDTFVRTIQGYDPDSEEAEEEFLKNISSDDGEEFYEEIIKHGTK
jgi:antitoxin component YwqK of YwqJK toxin-antitoxin module